MGSDYWKSAALIVATFACGFLTFITAGPSASLNDMLSSPFTWVGLICLAGFFYFAYRK